MLDKKTISMDRTSMLLLQEWMRKEVRQIIPHEMAVCGLATQSTLGVTLAGVVTMDMPTHYVDRATQLLPLGCPAFSRWLLARTPQFVDSERSDDSGITTLFHEFNMKNMLLHGFADVETGYVTYFGLYEVVPAGLTKYQSRINSLAEVIHNKLLSCLTETRMPSANTAKITSAEQEVLLWLRKGKTNWEIGKILGKSQWTVKTQVQHILRKMDVPNRHALRDTPVMILSAEPGRVFA